MRRSALQRASREPEPGLDMEVKTLLSEMTSTKLANAGIIPWSSPVPVFGDPSESAVATVGLNPSNREFVDLSGRELEGSTRRFHTLKSLGLRSWAEARHRDVLQISEACREYFTRNPYDLWFKALDRIIQGTGASFYPSAQKACHLDLVPFATRDKWTALSSAQRTLLLKSGGRAMATLLSSSPIQLLVLNGSSVVREAQNALQITLETRHMRQWDLRRVSGEDVQGVAYFGKTSSICGINLSRRITILGYNHNIQSSFGVTRSVRTEIARWIMNSAADNIR